MPHLPRSCRVLPGRGRALSQMVSIMLALALAACDVGSSGTEPGGVTVVLVTVSPTAPVLLVGSTQQLTAIVRDANRNVLSGRTITWSSSVPGIASVSASGLVTGLNVGASTVTATVEGINGSSSITTLNAPQISSVNPTTLVPGALATVVGTSFDPVQANDTVTVQGAPAVIATVSATQISFYVPCVASGTVGVRVRTRGGASALQNATLAGTVRTIALGQAYISPDVASTGCTELALANTPARYVVAVFSNAANQHALTDFDISGNGIGLVPDTKPSLTRALPMVTPSADPNADPNAAQLRRADAAHLAFLERERRWYATERPRGVTMQSRVAVAPRTAVVLGDRRNFYFTYSGGCNDSTQVVSAKAIYVGSKAIVWEDTANTLQSAALPALLSNYTRLGFQFDTEQYQSDSTYFGDPLRRDVLTDNDGHVQMVFTQRLNATGAAAYVTGCDQFARGSGFSGSNFGELFYGFVPTVATPSVSNTNAVDGWFAFMGRTVVHEVKHIVSTAARVANNAPAFEESWLEEGTARMAEEMWVRTKIHNATWKGNTGFGTAASNGLFCDFTLADATCLANDATHRPSWGLRRQFDELLPKLQQPWNWSPFGDGTAQNGSVFYQTTWSLVRYTMDRYASTEEGFLNSLTGASITGTANLAARAGVPFETLLGGWGLALYADDYPGLAGASADIQYQTWNLRDIYAGLNAQPAWSARFRTPFPMVPAALTWGGFSQRVTGVRGGAHMLFEISGTPSANQLISISSTTGGAGAPGTLRIAITRVQ